VLLQPGRCSPTKYANYQIDNKRKKERLPKRKKFSIVRSVLFLIYILKKRFHGKIRINTINKLHEWLWNNNKKT